MNMVKPVPAPITALIRSYNVRRSPTENHTQREKKSSGHQVRSVEGVLERSARRQGSRGREKNSRTKELEEL